MTVPAASPRPGAFGLTRISGVLGMAIAAGQAFTLDGSRYTHAVFVVDGGSVVQAMPSGAELAPLSEFLGRDDVRWCDAPVQRATAEHDVALQDPWTPGWTPDPILRWARVESFERNLRAALAYEARDLVGTPYGFSDYLALTLAHLGFRPQWLRTYIARSGRLICSQLVDETFRRQGLHLFTDGRIPMDVTPGDLDNYRTADLEATAATLEETP